MYQGNDYWKNYMERWFGASLIQEWEQNVKLTSIESEGRRINLEIYESADKTAPVIVFSHGIAGYARVLLPLVIPLFKKGYTLVVPDLQGYGYNEGVNGDFEWNAHVANLKDAVAYAQMVYQGPIWLGGASMGGPLAYEAASAIDSVEGLLCWCLWDFSDREFMLNETKTKGLTFALIPILKFLAKFLGRMRIKTYALVSYDTLTDSKEFVELLKADPQAGTHVTLKGAASLLADSKPKVSHEAYKKPVLVVQPGADRMTPVKYVKRTFERLGSAKKHYVEIPEIAHFPTDKDSYRVWAEEVDGFIKACDK